MKGVVAFRDEKSSYSCLTAPFFVSFDFSAAGVLVIQVCVLCARVLANVSIRRGTELSRFVLRPLTSVLFKVFSLK